MHASTRACTTPRISISSISNGSPGPMRRLRASARLSIAFIQRRNPVRSARSGDHDMRHTTLTQQRALHRRSEVQGGDRPSCGLLRVPSHERRVACASLSASGHSPPSCGANSHAPPDEGRMRKSSRSMASMTLSATCSGSSMPSTLATPPSRSLDHRRSNRLRTEDRDPYAAIAVSDREPLGESDRGMLGHRIGRRLHMAQESGGRGGVDQVTGAALSHARCDGPCGIDMRHDVDVPSTAANPRSVCPHRPYGRCRR